MVTAEPPGRWVGSDGGGKDAGERLLRGVRGVMGPKRRFWGKRDLGRRWRTGPDSAHPFVDPALARRRSAGLPASLRRDAWDFLSAQAAVQVVYINYRRVIYVISMWVLTCGQVFLGLRCVFTCWSRERARRRSVRAFEWYGVAGVTVPAWHVLYWGPTGVGLTTHGCCWSLSHGLRDGWRGTGGSPLHRSLAEDRSTVAFSISSSVPSRGR